MTRYEAEHAIYNVISSAILNAELEDTLVEVANCICENDFAPCPVECLKYCKMDECPHTNKE